LLGGASDGGEEDTRGRRSLNRGSEEDASYRNINLLGPGMVSSNACTSMDRRLGHVDQSVGRRGVTAFGR
jgi:hypothetical protein